MIAWIGYRAFKISEFYGCQSAEEGFLHENQVSLLPKSSSVEFPCLENLGRSLKLYWGRGSETRY